MSGSLYVVAGEMSGDAHAAGLLESLIRLRPGLEVAGAGGAKMRAVAGERIRDWVEQAGVMGVVEVLKHYSFFKNSFEEMLGEIREMKPDVLLLVDYPGFNFRFAAAVRRHLPETRIIQYVCPQVWAWKKGRIPKMVELFDEVLCLLPFEPAIFEGTGLKATFVGHPLVDELEAERVSVERDPKVVALMPGSRAPEVEKLFPMMLETAERLYSQDDSLVFEVPAARPSLRARMEKMAEKIRLGDALVIRDGGAHELMQRAACGVVASGTATVEAGYYGLPYCLVYKLAWPTYMIAKMVVKIRFIGLINILADDAVIEEFIQSDADPCEVARTLECFLCQPDEVEALQKRLAETVALLGGTGAHERAAGAVNRWFPG
ncbi:lipid-A-disaccharide synthase [Haloferula helveola]|uniref:Lipid-A-disaccharide synthase n=1 Tax=Haloferula helveola TaxID=490095 RepID=A0ABM7RAI1_9BACT|nr:lipid-A-disaccharide synthase [Haloferula helveola]